MSKQMWPQEVSMSKQMWLMWPVIVAHLRDINCWTCYLDIKSWLSNQPTSCISFISTSLLMFYNCNHKYNYIERQKFCIHCHGAMGWIVRGFHSKPDRGELLEVHKPLSTPLEIHTLKKQSTQSQMHKPCHRPQTWNSSQNFFLIATIYGHSLEKQFSERPNLFYHETGCLQQPDAMQE